MLRKKEAALLSNDATDFMKPIILGCEGLELSIDETHLFADHRPVGFILFQRNCQSKAQVTELCAALRDAVDAPDAPILIDQEGGSVARLKSPEWPEYPAAGQFGKLAATDIEAALEATKINSRLMAEDLHEMGVTVNCNPVIDVPSEDCHGFLSDSRTFHDKPELVTKFGNAVCEGLLEGGVTPILKHIPGHGRATVDSHKLLPVIDASLALLQETDFVPFKGLSATTYGNDIWAMAAHVVYTQIDAEQAASVSEHVTEEIIRNYIGFNGVLLADDISMEALDGTLAERAVATLAAGMDLTMHCNGKFVEMVEILSAINTMREEAALRVKASEKRRQSARIVADMNALKLRLDGLMTHRDVA